MPFQVFKPKGSSAPIDSAFPFQVSIVNIQSGIKAGSFDLKCPCDTGKSPYSSQHFFKIPLPDVNSSGTPAFVVYSGSNLYQSYDIQASGYKYSYAFANPSYTCDQAKKSPVVIVYGLNKPIFISDFFAQQIPVAGQATQTLKIWLTVCFPKGAPTDDAYNDFTSHIGGQTCVKCDERQNKPLTAFISCGVTGWPQAVVTELVNKGTVALPRFEKRQLAANIPIAEINQSGKIIKQFLNNNLMLTDMCVQGFPARVPLSIFNEVG